MEIEMFDIITKVLSGNASLEDRQKLMNWVNQNQDNKKIYKQAESVWNAIEIMKTGKEYNTEHAFNQFKEKISNFELASSKQRLKSTIDLILRIAAIVIIVAGLLNLFFKPEKSIPKTEAAMSEIIDTAICEVIAPRGSKTQLVLYDGTKVWLNADSKFSYRKNFNNQNRETNLEGEGYFEVAANSDKPFIVNTSHIRIKALGTAFNVKSYADENTVETTLIEGKVELELKSAEGTKTKLITLKQNEEATFYKNGESTENQQSTINQNIKQKNVRLDLIGKQIFIKENENTDLTICWKENSLYFEDEAFIELAKKLERRFGVTIHLMDEDIKNVRFSGKFEDIIIEQVLEALQFASPFYYLLNEKDIYISTEPLENITLRINPS